MVVIEHNLDVIKTADWILDLGPGVADGAKRHRGVRGGEIVAEGTPEAVAQEPRSFTGAYLKPMLDKAATLAPARAKPARGKSIKAREAAE